MVTKGIIKTIDYNGNTCTVRVPFFETANNDEIVSEAAVSNTPGSYNGYKVGDVVWVAFEDGSMDHPVVIGKLYLGVESEKADPRGTLNVVDSRVSNSAEIPFDTKLGSNPADNVANTNVPFSSLDQVANSLSTAEVNIAQNDRDYGNRFKLVGEEINYEASRKLDHTGESEAFGWELKPEHWKVYKKTTANGATTTKDILTVNDDGLTVTGTVQADDGHIGKFLIGATHTCPVKDAEGNTTSTVQASGIFSENFIEKFEDEATKRGVYVGTDGIKVGSNFSVDTSGVVTATELVLKPENVYLEEEETDPETGRPRRRTLKKRIEDGDTATDTLTEVLENNLGTGITSTKMTSDFIVAPYLGVKGAHITDALVVGDAASPKLAIDIDNPAVKIGGFEVSTSGIYSTGFGSSYSAAGSKDSGIYVGTDGIKLGKTFSVSPAGAVVATNLTITGNKTIETALSDTQSAAENTAKGYADTAEGNAKTAAQGYANTAESNAKTAAQGYANTAESNAKTEAQAKLEAALSTNNGHTTLGDTWLSTTDVYARNLTVQKADITDKLEVKNGTNTIIYANTAEPNNVRLGNFVVDTNSISLPDSNGNKFGTAGSVIMCTGTSGTADIGGSGSVNGWNFAAGTNFGVRTDSSGISEFYASKGRVAGWNINSSSFSKTSGNSSVTLSPSSILFENEGGSYDQFSTQLRYNQFAGIDTEGRGLFGDKVNRIFSKTKGAWPTNPITAPIPACIPNKSKWGIDEGCTVMVYDDVSIGAGQTVTWTINNTGLNGNLEKILAVFTQIKSVKKDRDIIVKANIASDGKSVSFSINDDDLTADIDVLALCAVTAMPRS